MSIYAPMIGLLWRTLESYELDPREIIDEQHYDPRNQSLVNARVSFEYYDHVIGETARLINDPAVGLHAARHLHPSHLGALGYAWLASSRLRTALRRSERFTRMFNEQLVMRLAEYPDRVRISYSLRKKPRMPEEIADAQLAGLLTMCRMNFGSDLMPVEVTMRRAEPADPSPWHEFFGIPVQFGQPENSLSISAANADEPLTGSNRELLAIHEDVIRRHLTHIDRTSIQNRVRLAIMEELPSGRVTEERVSQVLSMSKRTLHRRLRDNATTFRVLLAEVRKELAERYIRDAKYSMTEVAFSLGYSDTSAFSRAYRGWFGESPSQARHRISGEN